MNAVQTRQQIGRIHAAKKTLGLAEPEYRRLLESLTGVESCARMTDRQINHVLDWLNFLAGRRPRQPVNFDRTGLGNPHANMVRVCYAVADIIPPGFTKSPLRSMKWQERVTGRCCAFFEEFAEEELWKLIEGLKAIFRRAGQRDTATLDQHPLSPQMDDAAHAGQTDGGRYAQAG